METAVSSRGQARLVQAGGGPLSLAVIGTGPERRGTRSGQWSEIESGQLIQSLQS